MAANLAEAGYDVLVLEAGGDDAPDVYSVPAFHALGMSIIGSTSSLEQMVRRNATAPESVAATSACPPRQNSGKSAAP